MRMRGVSSNSTIEAKWDKRHSFMFNVLLKEHVQFADVEYNTGVRILRALQPVYLGKVILRQKEI